MKVLQDQTNLQIHILDERFYQSPSDENKFYPGATTVLQVWPKTQLNEWFKEVGFNADIKLERAGEIGTHVHEAIEQFLLGNPIMIEADEQIYTIVEWEMVTKFMQFYYRYRPETISVERVFVSDELEYGGMLDWICKIENEIWYIDFKTSNNLWKEHYYQIAAYKRLAESLGQPIDRIGLLHLKAATRTEKEMQGVGWKVYPLLEIDNALRMFDHAHAIWKEENPNFKPKNKIFPMQYLITEYPDKELLYGK